MDLYNVQTRQKEAIDDQDALHNALLQGTHSFQRGAQIRVTSPDGMPGLVPAENISQAVSQGYQVETPRQKIIREHIEKNDNMLGSLKVGLGQLADEALIGLPEMIYDKTGDPLEVAKKQALKREHELANTMGGVGGFIASLFFGGPLFKGATKAGEATAQGIKHLGSKVATQAGEEVGTRTARQVARDIAADATGAGVEGTILSMPHAVTEAALGDPEAAAETMLAGAGLGAVFGGGLSLSKELLGLGKKVAKESARLVDEKDLTLKDIARKGSKVLTGVDENDLLYYMKNSDKVNQAPSMEAIKDEIDDLVRQKADDVLVSKELLKDNALDMQLARNNAVRDLREARPSQQIADDMVRALENEKAVLGEMSARADDALLGVEGNIDRRVLIRFINNVKKDVAPVKIGDEAVQASAKLETLAGRVRDELPTKIPFDQVRTVLQQVRKDIKWNQLAGEFNETANLAKKGFTSSLSNLLKKKVPEYAQIMDQMAGRAKTLQSMSKAFGNPLTTAKKLDSLTKPGNDVLRRQLDTFSDMTGIRFSDEIADIMQKKEILKNVKGDNLDDVLIPELAEKKRRLQQQLVDAEAVYDPIRRLTPDRTQNAIRNMGFKVPNIETRRAIEALEEQSGRPLLEQIRDRNVLDSFGKASTQGSRKTNLLGALGFGTAGGVAGLGVGGPMGAAAGALAGATMDVYGGRLLKNFIDKSPNVAGLLFVEKAMKRTADKLDDIPEAIQRAKKKKPISKRTIGIGALTRIFDPEAKPDFSREAAAKNIEKIDNDLRDYLVNDYKFEELINKMSAPLAEGGAPNISTGVTIGTRRALEYLYSKVPRAPAPSSPFAPEIEWTPSDYQMNEFAQAVQVANDPLSVIDEYENGGLTNAHMDALRHMFPQVAVMIQNRIYDYAMSPDKEPLNYQDRLNLSLLAGAPMDDSLNPNFIVSMQQQPMAEAEQAQEQMQAEEASFTPKQNIDLADNSKTDFQSAIEE